MYLTRFSLNSHLEIAARLYGVIQILRKSKHLDVNPKGYEHIINDEETIRNADAIRKAVDDHLASVKTNGGHSELLSKYGCADWSSPRFAIKVGDIDFTCASDYLTGK